MGRIVINISVADGLFLICIARGVLISSRIKSSNDLIFNSDRLAISLPLCSSHVLGFLVIKHESDAAVHITSTILDPTRLYHCALESISHKP